MSWLRNECVKSWGDESDVAEVIADLDAANRRTMGPLIRTIAGLIGMEKLAVLSIVNYSVGATGISAGGGWAFGPEPVTKLARQDN